MISKVSDEIFGRIEIFTRKIANVLKLQPAFLVVAGLQERYLLSGAEVSLLRIRAVGKASAGSRRTALERSVHWQCFKGE